MLKLAGAVDEAGLLALKEEAEALRGDRAALVGATAEAETARRQLAVLAAQTGVDVKATATLVRMASGLVDDATDFDAALAQVLALAGAKPSTSTVPDKAPPTLPQGMALVQPDAPSAAAKKPVNLTEQARAYRAGG